MYVSDKFSPYLDPDPIADFLEDAGQRGIITSLLAFFVHVILFFVLQTRLDIPHVPDEPEPIIVEIISFEPEAEPEPEIEPEIQPEPEPITRAAVPPPTQAPVSKPKPEPKPKHEPKPEPEPEPKPEPVVVPPMPKIIESTNPETNTETETTAEQQPEVQTEPVLDIFDPELVSQIEPELAPEPVLDIPDTVIEPVIEPVEPIAPIFDADILDSDIEPEDLPEINEILELAPNPVITEEPVSGVEKPELEPEPELLPPPAPLYQQDILETPLKQIEAQSEPEILEIPDIEIAAIPPTILASPDAPTTQAEIDNSIPQEQASTPLDFILKGRDNPGSSAGNPTNPNVPFGNNNPNAPTFQGSTPRTAPGSNGWQVGGTWPSDGLPGGAGIIRDIDCRAEKRDHEDCPEYVRGNTGRASDGFEAFGPHTPLGTSTVKRSRGMAPNLAITPSIGDPGSPSTGVLQDANGFNGQFLGDDVGPRDQGRRIRDVFSPPDAAPWTTQPELLPEPEEKEEEDTDALIILKKPE